MQEARDTEQPVEQPENDQTLDATAMSALLSSRICHDLINPVGAIGSGLEVLDDPSMDGAMHEAALDLIRSGAGKAIALLTYARLAYGAAGGYGAQISLEDAQKVLVDLFATVKPELDWQIEGGYADKENVKVILILAYAAADCVPRGGIVQIAGDVNDITITATGKKVLLQDDLLSALRGETDDIAPKYMPALIALKLAEDRGGHISATKDDEKVVFKAVFGDGSGV